MSIVFLSVEYNAKLDQIIDYFNDATIGGPLGYINAEEGIKWLQEYEQQVMKLQKTSPEYQKYYKAMNECQGYKIDFGEVHAIKDCKQQKNSASGFCCLQ